MKEKEIKVCPFCKTEIKEGEEVAICPSCGMPHHMDCWMENNGCTTFGCPECKNNGIKIENDKIYPNSQNSIKTDNKYYPESGTTITQETTINEDKIGDNSPEEVDRIAEYNATLVNKKNEKRKKKKLIGILLAAVIAIIVLVIVVNTGKNPSSVMLRDNTVTIDRGDTYVLTYTITPDSAENREVTWESSDEDTVSVDQGTITGELTGTATITVKTENGKKDTCTVEVVMPKVEKKIVGKWNITKSYEKSTGRTDNLKYYGYYVSLYDDNTGEISWGDSSGEFLWIYTETDDGHDVYVTSEDNFGFIYDDGALYVILMGDDDTYIYSCETSE